MSSSATDREFKRMIGRSQIVGAFLKIARHEKKEGGEGAQPTRRLVAERCWICSLGGDRFVVDGALEEGETIEYLTTRLKKKYPEASEDVLGQALRTHFELEHHKEKPSVELKP